MSKHTPLRIALAALFVVCLVPAAFAGVPWDKISGSSRFELTMGDQAVLDNETGLIWVRRAPRVGTEFGAAEKQCANLRIADRMGWRLPTVDELTSLVSLGTVVVSTTPSPTSTSTRRIRSLRSPALPSTAPFLDVATAGFYWTSTPADRDLDRLRYAVTFDRSVTNRVFEVSRFGGGTSVQGGVGVWCVRGDK